MKIYKAEFYYRSTEECHFLFVDDIKCYSRSGLCD